MDLLWTSILRIRCPVEAEEIRIRFDERWAYISTPTGVWRMDKDLASTSSLTQLALGKGEINDIYVEDDGLYVLKQGEPAAGGHCFLYSSDQGETFQPLDSALQMEQAGTRSFLIPTRMIKAGGTFFLNAGGGGNVLVSTDRCRSWRLLNGSMGTQIGCSPGEIFLNDHELTIGGECPLDFAYLQKGLLSPSFDAWQTALQWVAPRDISNRNVQFIAKIDAWQILFAGVEGGLLVSRDFGATWSWSVQHVLNSGFYPYMKRSAKLPGHDSAAVAGGFDKDQDSLPYLALTLDRGQSWKNISKSLGALGGDLRQVEEICVHPDGRLLLATYDISKSEIIIAAGTTTGA